MSDECYTPKWFIDSVRAVLGRIDLDPCSCEAANRIVEAGRFWSKEDDCLEQPTWAEPHDRGRSWSPAKVFMNPPYGRAAGGAGPYCHRLIEEWEAGNVSEAIILLNVATATKWMQPLFRFPMCFITPRIKFKTVDPETGEIDFVRTKKGNICPRYDNVAVYLPDREDMTAGARRFTSTFKNLHIFSERMDGNVVLPMAAVSTFDVEAP